MKLKKTLALLCALTTAGVFAACSSDASGSDSSSSTANSSAADASSSEAETTTTEATTKAPETTTTEETEPPAAPIDANAITFDTPSLYTATALDDAGAAPVKLEVVDLNGDKKLRVKVERADETKPFDVPKIKFDLPKLIGVDKTGEIDHFSVDFTCISQGPFTGDDGTVMSVVGNFLGALGGNIASEKKKDGDTLIQNDWAQQEFSFQEWEKPVMTWHYETKKPLLPTNNYAANDEGVNLLIMRWGQPNQVDFYIDNLTIYDHDGKAIPIIFDAEKAKVDVVEDKGEPYVVEGAAAPSGDASSAAETTTTAVQ